MKSLWNILDDEPLAVGYTCNSYVSLELRFFWLFLTWNAYSLWHCSSLALSSSLSMWSLLERLRYSLILPSACSNWASNSASSSREPSWKKHKTFMHFYMRLCVEMTFLDIFPAISSHISVGGKTLQRRPFKMWSTILYLGNHWMYSKMLKRHKTYLC